MIYEFSIVIPVYNESFLVYESLSRIYQSLNKRKALIVIVDNDSTDDTLVKIKLWKKEHPQAELKILKEKTRGVMYAKKSGLFYAKKVSPTVISLDIDCKPALGFKKDILNFCNDDQADVLFGYIKQDSKTRLLKQVFLLNSIKTLNLFEKLDKKIFGLFFFGGFFGIKSKYINENIFNTHIPIKTEPSIFWSRRCYYSGLIFKDSQSVIECSSRRFWSDSEGFFSLDKNYSKRVRIPKISRRIFIMKKLSKNETNMIPKIAESFSFRMLMLLLDAVWFEKYNPVFTKTRKVIDRACLYFNLPKNDFRSLTNYNFLDSQKYISDLYTDIFNQKLNKLLAFKNYEKLK